MNRDLIEIHPAQDQQQVDDAAKLVIELVETNKHRYGDKLEVIESLYRDGWFYKDRPKIPLTSQPPNGIFLIAYSAKIPAGTGALSSLGGGFCELKWLFVPEHYRGSGIALALCNKLICTAGKQGYTGIRLRTGDRQPEASRLYLKLGFLEVNAWETTPLDGARYFQRMIDDQS